MIIIKQVVKQPSVISNVNLSRLLHQMPTNMQNCSGKFLLIRHKDSRILWPKHPHFQLLQPKQI